MRSHKFLLGFLTIVSIISLSVIGVSLYYIFIKDKSPYIGTWVREQKITNMVRGKMDAWLWEADLKIFVDYPTDNVTVDMIVTFDRSGNITVKSDKKSFDSASEVASKIGEAALTDFLTKRLAAAGTDVSSLNTDVNLLLEEALGMSVAEYMSEYGPKIMPDAEEVDALFAGTYTYREEDGRLIITDTDTGEEKTATYVVDDDKMVITTGRETYIYSKK
ncbi:MAG: hypothetical protein J6033_04610 [Lachnospiraceae bacterium]|nr:hypothetical protein [Lachnospiraceae bacterium]